MLKTDWPPARGAKFRQAGFVYLHVAILYEAAVYAMLDAGTLPLRFGPPWAWLIAGAFVAAPFAEETFFRGILQTFVRKLLRSRWAAILTTGLIFGLIHGVQPQAILPLSLLGCVLGFAYERTGSLVCPMIIHALFNGRTLLYQMLGTSG